VDRVHSGGGVKTSAFRQWLILAGPAMLVLAAFYLYPIARLGVMSIGTADPGLTAYAALARNDLFLSIALRTFRISVAVTLICLVAGFPVAYLLTRVGQRAAAVMMIAILLPFWTSILVRTYAWMVLLQSNGLLNKTLVGAGIITNPLRLMYNEIGVTIGMVQILLPFAILPIYASLQNIDPRLNLAAQVLGAGAWKRFWNVTLPLSLPGVAAAAILVFVQGLGYFVTPALLGGSRVITLAMFIESQVTETLAWQSASAIAVVLLIVCVTIVAGFERVLGLERVWR
jgi:ABC-type spermidine/putrescine transport system permease subunit I